MLELIISGLFFIGIMLIFKGRIIDVIMGIILWGNGVNLIIFKSSDIKTSAYPFINEELAIEGYSDPVPQALVLTAIVISFAILAYLIALFKKLNEDYSIVSIDELASEDLCDE